MVSEFRLNYVSIAVPKRVRITGQRKAVRQAACSDAWNDAVPPCRWESARLFVAPEVCWSNGAAGSRSLCWNLTDSRKLCLLPRRGMSVRTGGTVHFAPEIREESILRVAHESDGGPR